MKPKKPKLLLFIGWYWIIISIFSIPAVRLLFEEVYNAGLLKPTKSDSFLIFFLSCVSFIQIIAGIGLILFKEWGWKISIFNCYIGIIFMIITLALNTMFFDYSKSSIKDIIQNMTTMAMFSLILLYLLREKTKNAIKEYNECKEKFC